MHIGGFQKNTLIDFPGEIACLVFTPGCNFTCPYCHNPALAAGPVNRAGTDKKTAPEFTEEEIFAFLKRRRGMIQGVAITGGEPTLQKDLPDFIRRVRDMGFKIKLDSNGTRPAILARLMEQGLVDYLAMDIKTDLEHYPLVMKNTSEVESIRESIDLIIDKALGYEFRTTCARPFITREIMAKIGKMIQGASTYILQNCSRNVDILDPSFLTDDHHFFTQDEMEDLKQTISPFVQKAAIR
ncbi:MAG: anaerobic ribonucleoside-triphosphate reductase activating protein [Desulfobacter sp.]|nr:MAG: anaerobic ribonucleoside-triphosphate reductase activating protein [Desulfobacter sp.]